MNWFSRYLVQSDGRVTWCEGVEGNDLVLSMCKQHPRLQLTLQEYMVNGLVVGEA